MRVFSIIRKWRVHSGVKVVQMRFLNSMAHNIESSLFEGAVGGIDSAEPSEGTSGDAVGAISAASEAAAAPDIDIDEALFDPDDLDDLDEELETLDIDS